MAESVPAGESLPPPAPSRTEKLLLATGNPGKARELAQLLRGLPWPLVTLGDAGISAEVEEAGATLEENAALKAHAYARQSGLWALADDSGLEVDALGGAPGPRSKRYAGDSATDQQRVRHLLHELRNVPREGRGARFRSVIALASPQGDLRLYQGICHGIITLQPRGAGGFGYDPVFLLPSLGRTMAELSLEEKNRVSHRAMAARALVEDLTRTSSKGLDS